jgi:hypothetical protein
MQHVLPLLDSMHVSSNGVLPCRVVTCRVIQFESVFFPLAWLPVWTVSYTSARVFG